MRTAVINLPDFSCRGFVGRQKFRIRFVQSICQNLRFFIVLSLGQMLETRLQSEKFTEGIPAQISFFLELFDMFWCGTSGAGCRSRRGLQR